MGRIIHQNNFIYSLKTLWHLYYVHFLYIRLPNSQTKFILGGYVSTVLNSLNEQRQVASITRDACIIPQNEHLAKKKMHTHTHTHQKLKNGGYLYDQEFERPIQTKSSETFPVYFFWCVGKWETRQNEKLSSHNV